jgi:urease accessory protein
MDICNSILSHFDLSADIDTISLTYDERLIRRKKLISDNGYEFLVDLEEMKSVFNDQAFELKQGKIIKIKSKEERLIEIRSSNLNRLVWHIGNRHIPCQIETDRILIQEDDIIQDMIHRLGGETKLIIEQFNPEGGAYGIGRTHGHKH